MNTRFVTYYRYSYWEEGHWNRYPRDGSFTKVTMDPILSSWNVHFPHLIYRVEIVKKP